MVIAPPTFRALEPYPALRRQIADALLAQEHRIRERTAGFLPRPELLAILDRAIAGIGSGVVSLDGPRGMGATSIVCHLAATRGYPIWLPEDDAGGGLEALCAQLLILAQSPLPLVPPAARRDATALETLLADAASRRSGPEPLVVLIGRFPGERASPTPPIFPAQVPPGVALVVAGTPPVAPNARVRVGRGGRELAHCLVDLALQQGCTPGLAATVVAKSNGSPLYVRLASGLLETGVLRRFTLPETLEGLHDAWWHAIDGGSRRLVTLLAAAEAPMPIGLWADLARVSHAAVERTIARWRPLLEVTNGMVRLYHPATVDAISRYNNGLADADAAIVEFALARSGKRFERLLESGEAYLARHLARHLALSPPATRARMPLLVDRNWLKARERTSGNRKPAAHDAAWELRALANDGELVALVRSAVLAGSLATLGRTLSPDALAETVTDALEQGNNRDAVLRRARDLADQLPPNYERAAVLRRLGEVCHAAGMRAPAMRMLSEALDLEVPGLPRTWIDEREETLVALARAAIGRTLSDRALGITTQITHSERRGMIETEVVRSLIVQDELVRAEEVALAIGHGHTHEWAMAEVAVAHARAGNRARAAEVLGTLRTDTAVAWARGELACDAARQGQPSAIEQIATIGSESLRERALSLVVQALAAGGQHMVALAAARSITNRDTRVRTLIDLALLRPPNAAAALDAAATDLRAMQDDDATPLMVALCVAYATIGNIAGSLRTSMLLSEGEQRDRAHSRSAAALARQGEHTAAAQLASAIPDDDERYWTLHELARLRAEAGDQQGADALLVEIHDPEERARAEADVCIARARGGRAHVALEQAALLGLPDERLRALVAMTEALVQQNASRAARTAFARLRDAAGSSRFGAALATALANAGDTALAADVAQRIPRPAERARALVALARRQTQHDPALAMQTLARALRTVTQLGRSETFATLAAAADVLAALGGAEALLTIAHALDEIDSWWT